MRIVLDSSMSLTWCIPNQGSKASKAVLDQVKLEGATVPALWHLEMANILGLKLRDGNLLQADLNLALQLLDVLDIATEEPPAFGIRSYLERIIHFRLAAYDATYLDLALRTGASLATFDKAMIHAARQHAIPVLGAA